MIVIYLDDSDYVSEPQRCYVFMGERLGVPFELRTKLAGCTVFPDDETAEGVLSYLKGKYPNYSEKFSIKILTEEKSSLQSNNP